MGVLEARKDAEKVGYQVVGEEIKESSNVIDYNINEEITIDNTSVNNANNQTTTGMATLVYGVNAPKLMEKTSIYQNSEGYNGSSTLVFTSPQLSMADNTANIRSATITYNYGNIKFVNRDDNTEITVNGVVIPVSGWYKLDITYAHGTGTTVSMDTYVKMAYIRGEIIAQGLGIYSTTYTDTIYRYFNGGDAIYIQNVMHTSNPNLRPIGQTTIVITKI